jgi:hypothetical protein
MLIELIRRVPDGGPELRLHETTEDGMSESSFGTNAGVDGEENSYDADVSAATNADETSEADLTYAATDTSRAADESAAYEAPQADEDSLVDEDSVVDLQSVDEDTPGD